MKNPRFEELYKKFVSPLTRFVFKKIGSDPITADQIVSETFESAWIGYKSFKNKSSFFTWLCRIALNKIADYYRDQIHRRSHFFVPTLKRWSQIEQLSETNKKLLPEEQLILNELRQKVNNVLNLLPYEKRKLLWFRYYRDLSYKEISVILSATKGRSSTGRLISPRAVEGKIYRAKSLFSKVWNKNVL